MVPFVTPSFGVAFVSTSSRSSHAPSPARRFVSIDKSTVYPPSNAHLSASTTGAVYRVYVAWRTIFG